MQTLIKTALFIGITGFAGQAAVKTVSGFHHVESIAAEDRFLYAGDIGSKMDPSAKDGDGKIWKLDNNGKVIDSTFAKTVLNAPKGLAIHNHLLFLTDIDRIVALDLSSGEKKYEISFSGDAAFLNDIAVKDDSTLFVSATDKNKIFRVNLHSKKYEALEFGYELAGANGLAYDGAKDRLYVNGMGNDKQPKGVIGYVDLAAGKFTRIGTAEGLYDGMALDAKNNMLYVSDWVAFEKKGQIVSVDLRTNTLGEVRLATPLAGPADFTMSNGKLVVPEMMAGTIVFISNFK